jgi:DegV family protein with EDD domain
MEEYQIITDSTSDLTQEMVDELGVEVIPMSFTLGQDSYYDYPDERELSSHDFYSRIAAGETSTTNQISLTVFTETFEKHLQAGKDVLYIGFSSGLSGTYNNSVLVARELSEKYPEPENLRGRYARGFARRGCACVVRSTDAAQRLFH